ncbi:MAG: hypothetical protein M0009_11700 [Deltaproteobacteria bacterium]|nr:hypothetical protein [Deltaproteobacteria bacterium]
MEHRSFATSSLDFFFSARPGIFPAARALHSQPSLSEIFPEAICKSAAVLFFQHQR